METFLTILRYAAGPVLGALIGLFTNWLAVKMLFRPYYPKKIGKWQLPFTPGIIPKRKPALAKAVGKAVGEQLITKEDLASVLASEEVKRKVADYAVKLWESAGDKSAEEILNAVVSAEKQDCLKEEAGNFIGEKIYSAVTAVNLGEIVAQEGVKAINQKKSSLGMLAMFLSDELVGSLANKLADGVNGYVERSGKQLILKAVGAEMQNALSVPLSGVTQKVDKSFIENAARTLYERAVSGAFADIAESFDVCGVVEKKINDMPIKDLEKLVLSVMKKELNAIVWIGGLIGLILGVIMIFF